MPSTLALESRFVGGLPLVNAILDRLTVDRLLATALPSSGRVSPARALGVLLRHIVLNDRQPIYTHAEWAHRAEPALIGLAEGQAACLNDDRVGRALDRLFDADRAALLTAIVLRTIREFQVELDQLHNDSTTLTLTGEYRDAEGQEVRGQPTLIVTCGYNKDHRPDLKQLLFVLTVSADGAVPIHYRALDGNTNDSTTHIETWETRCRLRLRERVEEAAQQILKEAGAERWVRVEIGEWKEPIDRQEPRGHPGLRTRDLRRERFRFSVAARVNDEVVAADERSDGMFPLITNGKDLSLCRILEAYKFQPKLEKRHEQLKSVQDLAPMWLKNVSRIEALLFLYVVALLVHALLEREVRRGMAREPLDRLPLYPEERDCRAPTTERILDVFAPLQRHRLRKKGRLVQIFEPDLNDLHRQILGLMRLPTSLFRASR